MTVYGDRWERSFMGTRETAANSSVLLNTFHVNTMFACRCSEMIYYTCNMKPARWRSIRRCQDCWYNVVSVSWAWLRRCKFFSLGFGKLHWHSALRIIWRYKQDKIGRWDDGREGSPGKREHQRNKTCWNWCVFIKHTASCLENFFGRDFCIRSNRISLEFVDLTCFPLPTPWRHTSRLKSRIRN